MRRETTARRLIPAALAAGCYALALLQRPGLASSDTKIDLHVDPGHFLASVASVWSPTQGLGHIQGGQYSGYLWPMGPFFAALHAAGLGAWLVQRLWLGTLLALAAWGAVRLLDALLGRPRGVAHIVAGALFALNPYVVVFSNRTTITLLGCAALPWLLLVTHRGVRARERWWWAAAFALIVTSTGGGVNAAVTGWLLVGPLLLLVYEATVAGAGARAAGAFAWRAAAAAVAASVWWALPVLVQSRYGIDFLSFTEQVGSIWGTTSLSETLRLMGYWPSYLGVGYTSALGPYFGDSGTMLFDLPVVLATLVVPGLALAGFAWTRRWRYGAFFLALCLAGLLIMSVGFPEGTPGRRGATFTYNHVQAVQFLRTTYKAGPLVALSIACLAGAAAARLWPSVRRARVPAVAAAAALIALAAWPLFQGRAVELTWKRIPAAWRAAGRDLDRTLPANSRALVLPGQPFAFYTWGGTVDPILPALTRRPVAVRNVPPYDDLHATDLLWTVDDLVQQQRLAPGELAPLVDLMSARAVVTGADDDVARSGATPPAEAALTLAAQGLARPARAYGRVGAAPAPAQTVDPPARLPEVRRYDEPAALGLVRVEPRGPATVLDGSAAGVADLAALGGLTPGRPLLYAGDLSASGLRRALVDGSEVTITDSNRRRAFVASRSRQATGPTLPASERFSPDAAVLDPFPHRGSDAQTVATFAGARYVRAPYSPQIAQFPEHRPYAAFDGDPRTSWLADPTLDESRHWIEIGLDRPRAVPYVDILPDDSNPLVAVTGVDVDGRRLAIHPGWNRLPLHLRRVGAVRVTIVSQRTSGSNSGSAGGFSEIRIPGVHVRELLRPPLLAESALRSTDLRHDAIDYVFERTTADDPFRRGAAPPPERIAGNRAEAEAALVSSATDPERAVDRVFAPPAARRWRIDGLATVDADAPDSALDRLAGTRTFGSTFESSGRFEGRPAFRASSAFAGGGWVAPWSGRAWISWTTPRPTSIARLTLERPGVRARFPTRVRLDDSPPEPVARDGTVVFPRPIRGRRFRLTVLAAGGATAPAVGIGAIRGSGARAEQPLGAVHGRCGDLAANVGGDVVEMRAVAWDGGEVLRVEGCGSPTALPAHGTQLHVGTALLVPYVVRLRSAAPDPLVHAAGPAGSVRNAGQLGRSSVRGVRVDVTRPSWLVLGESYSRGWRASCDGRALGAPVVVDGFANGWPVDRGCHAVSFTFAPQRVVDAGYAVGAAACLLLLALLVLARRRRAGISAAADGLAAAARPPFPLPRAFAVAIPLACVVGFVFSLRAGAVSGPLLVLILWRGVRTRALTLAAGFLLTVVVPLLYALFPGDDRGGYDTQYAVEHLGAHWVAVAAFVLLALALADSLGAAPRRPRLRRRRTEEPPLALTR